MGLFRRKEPENWRDTDRIEPAASAPVQVQLMGKRSLDIVNARNISMTGIGVWVPHGFEPEAIGAEMELVVTLPGQRPYLAKGILRHFQDLPKSFFGVEFSDLPEPLRGHLESYIREAHARVSDSRS